MWCLSRPFLISPWSDSPCNDCDGDRCVCLRSLSSSLSHLSRGYSTHLPARVSEVGDGGVAEGVGTSRQSVTSTSIHFTSALRSPQTGILAFGKVSTRCLVSQRSLWCCPRNSSHVGVAERKLFRTSENRPLVAKSSVLIPSRDQRCDDVVVLT